MNDDATITACPACDSPSIERTNLRHGTEHGKAWRCKKCLEVFDDPVERPPRTATKPRGLAGELYDADPEAIG